MPVRAIKLPHYYATLRASLQRDPDMEDADQSRPTYTLMQAVLMLLPLNRRRP